ncbi:hypothetical protein ACFQ2Y_06065 [Streptomyces malaysiensis subsp. malaysiensis]
MAHDIADDQGDPFTGQRDEVVPVAADLHALGGGQIARLGGDRRDGGQRTGQQPALELLGAGVLGVVQPGPLQRLGDQSAQGDEQGTVLLGEVARPCEAHHAVADLLVGGDQGRKAHAFIPLR